MSARRITALVAATASSLVVAAPAGAAAPVVEHMVVGKDGAAKKAGKVRAGATRVKVGRKRCGVPQGTAIAAIVRAKPGTLRFWDFGSCSSRSRDAGGLYLRGVGRDIVRSAAEPDGWVYKVGNKAAPAGGADPSGPFGRGKLRKGQRVLWFWCVMQQEEDGCQRTLDMKVRTGAGGQSVQVKAYDNAGKAIPAEGATLFDADGPVGTTDAAGRAQLSLSRGTHKLYATKDGLVRSFPVRVAVG